MYGFKEKCLRFRFNIQYLPGGKNVTLDCMSRNFKRDKKEDGSEVNYDKFELDNKVGAAISAC